MVEPVWINPFQGIFRIAKHIKSNETASKDSRILKILMRCFSIDITFATNIQNHVANQNNEMI
jgi:hypothetical protein